LGLHPGVETGFPDRIILSKWDILLQFPCGIQKRHEDDRKILFTSTLQRNDTENSKQIFPEREIARPQSQFPNSCIYERFIYSHNLSAYYAAGNMWTDPGNI
jgi:hypothetical protein